MTESLSILSLFIFLTTYAVYMMRKKEAVFFWDFRLQSGEMLDIKNYNRAMGWACFFYGFPLGLLTIASFIWPLESVILLAVGYLLLGFIPLMMVSAKIYRKYSHQKEDR